MSARAASRSRSRSADSSARGSWSSGRSAGAPARRGGGHVRQAFLLHVEIAHGTEHAAQPAQLLAEHLGPHGEDVGEQRQRGAQATGRHPHVVELLGVLTEACPRLLGAHHRQLPAQDGEGELAHRRVAGDRGRAEVGWTGDLLAHGEEARLELRQPRRLEPARRPQLLDDRVQRIEPLGPHLDLDPAQLRGSLPAPDDDHGVVERDLGGVDAADPQGEGTAPGPDLQDLAQAVRADDGAQPAPDGSVGPERGDAGRRQDLGHLEALAQAAALGRAGVLQGDLVVPAAPPGADDEPGTGDAPVVGVEVGVDQPPWRPGQCRDRPAVTGLDREGRQRGEPTLDRSQVEGVELPFDLDGIGLAPLSLVPGVGHAGQATARRRRHHGPPIAADRPVGGGNLPAVARRAMTAELPSPTDVVQAAGGLVVRRHHGALQIVVVHRPEQQDWSFPKGKLDPRETFEAAALREVREETGMACRLLRFIGHTEYVDRKGRPKAVAYWVMAAEAGFFTPNEEVDELRWLTLEAASRILSYPRDRELIAVLMAADQVESLI